MAPPGRGDDPRRSVRRRRARRARGARGALGSGEMAGRLEKAVPQEVTLLVVTAGNGSRGEPTGSGPQSSNAKEIVHAAGGIVVDGNGADQRIAIVHRPK